MSLLTPLLSRRDLTVNLTLRELRGKYKRSALGWAWSLLNPLASVATFAVVFRFFLKVPVPVGDPSGLQVFALYLVCGLLPWNFLANGIVAGTGAVVGNANLVKKVFFPRQILPLASTGAWAISLAIELGVVAIILLIAGNFVLPWLPAVVLVLAVQAVFVLGIAMLMASATVYFRDLEHLVGIGLQLWFYATPIIYPIALVEDGFKDRPWLMRLYDLNPMVHFVEVYRNLFYDLRAPAFNDVAVLVVAAAVSLTIGSVVFARLEPRFAEEL
jgi:ABC-type polysaccharide/polyol phosphate export permease